MLITDLDDERLDVKKNPTYPANIVGVRNAIGDIMMLRDSLRAALEGLWTPPVPGLTPAEDERLALLMEEMGECLQIIGKILRHGYKSRHPDGGPTNRELLEKEIGHVQAAVEMLTSRADLSMSLIVSHSKAKKVNVKKYLHHQ